MEKYWIPLFTSYQSNSTNIVLWGWLWHLITPQVWYAIKWNQELIWIGNLFYMSYRRELVHLAVTSLSLNELLCWTKSSGKNSFFFFFFFFFCLIFIHDLFVHYIIHIRNLFFLSVTLALEPYHSKILCPIGWGCRIHRLHFCRGVRHPPLNECPGYDIKQSDGEVSEMLKLWGMQSTPSMSLLQGPFCLRVVAHDKVLSMGHVEVLDI